MSDELKALHLRVRELEATVLYLSNTLAAHGLIGPTEARPARDMYDRARQDDSKGGRRR